MLSGDLKMASFCSDMEGIHQIVMERPDINVSIVLSTQPPIIQPSPEETKNVNTVEASRVMDKHGDGNQFVNNAIEMKRRL